MILNFSPNFCKATVNFLLALIFSKYNLGSYSTAYDHFLSNYMQISQPCCFDVQNFILKPSEIWKVCLSIWSSWRECEILSESECRYQTSSAQKKQAMPLFLKSLIHFSLILPIFQCLSNESLPSHDIQLNSVLFN